MERLLNLPWYGYVLLILGIIALLERYFKKEEKNSDSNASLFNAKFRKSTKSNLTQAQLFSISLDAVITEWWKVDTNTLYFTKGLGFKNYLKGWGIDTIEGYKDLTNYFIKNGRRSYFDFIFNMIKTDPEENWNKLIKQKFGNNERAFRYLNLLKSNQALNTLKEKGFFNAESELEIGVVAYDVSVLIGHARRAFTAQLITEENAWQIIDFATQLAKDNFSSWEEYGKSHILGFTLDIRDREDGYIEEYYHLYKQILENPQSPWNTVKWQN